LNNIWYYNNTLALELNKSNKNGLNYNIFFNNKTDIFLNGSDNKFYGTFYGTLPNGLVA
jgi:hypothetical protein